MSRSKLAAIIIVCTISIIVAIVLFNGGGAEVDKTPPVISGVSYPSIIRSTATITWTSDEPATGQVEYGPTTGYGSITVLDSALVTSHRVYLNGVTTDTTYHYRVKSKDASGNEAVSGDYTFTTVTLADNPSPCPCGFTTLRW